MGQVEKTVFLSYRRANIPWALTIFQNLKRHGYDVFIDYKGIASGSFERVILDNIGSRAHFLVLLTPSALNRCREPGDWFRREIETAIDLQRNIVPIFLKGFGFKSPQIASQLTGKLAALQSYNGLTVPADYFDEAMARLRKSFLNVSLETVLHPVSDAAILATSDDQEAAEAAPQVTEAELTAQEWFERGCALSNPKEEMRCWNETIRLDPNFGLAFHNRAGLFGDRDDLEAALSDYNEAVRLMPDDPSSWVFRGVTRRKLGDEQGARDDFAQAYGLAPEATHQFLIENGHVPIPVPAELKAALSDPDKAVRDNAEKALELWEVSYRFSVDDDMDLGRKYNVMLRILGEAIDHFPKFATAYRKRGELYVALLDHKSAVPQFTKAIRLNPRDAHAYSERGWARWRYGNGNTVAALRDLDAAVRLEPENWLFLENRGRIRRDYGDFKGARADFDEAIRIKPDHASCYYERALVLKHLGRRADAINDFEMYLDRERTTGYRDYHEEENARTLVRELRKTKKYAVG